MSLAFYASPIDYKNNDLENKIKTEKSKIDKNALMTIQQGTLQESSVDIGNIHKNLKEESDAELSNFYKSEIKIAPQYKTNDYMILNSTNMVEPKKQTNQELLDKMNKILEMFEDQKEIKTGQKNEEIVLYCFLGVFIIYIMDSFVNIGRYSR
jgi:formylmethanofuran dehydrogenase subunit E-like metal-binding protein